MSVSVTYSPVRSADGTPINMPCLFVEGVYLYITGSGDDSVNGRGAGQQIKVERTDAGESSVEWYFNDAIYMAGGGASFINAVLGDYATLEIVAPATVVTPNAQNQGNCNVVSTVVIVPAAGDGAYDVVLADAVPVPAQTEEGYNGYWDLSTPTTGKGTITPGTPGLAHYHLLTVEQKLIRYANKLPLLGGGDLNLTLPAVEPKVQIPQWKGRLTIHNEGGSHALQVVAFLMTARAVTL